MAGKYGAKRKSKSDLSYLENSLLSRHDLIEPIKTWGFTDVIRCCFINYHDLFLDYIRYHASLFTTERRKISANELMKRIFGNISRHWRPDVKELEKELFSIVDEEILINVRCS